VKRKYLITVLSLSIIFNLSGCTKQDSDIMGFSGNIKDEIQYAVIDSGEIYLPLTTLKTLNPLMTNNLSYFYFSKLIYEGLFEFDDNLKPIPELVYSYSIGNGGKTISLKLRDDVYWHDGEKFTSKDVLFTINALNNLPLDSTYGDSLYGPLSSSTNGKLRDIINANIVDDYNIEIIFNTTYSNCLEILTFPIIPSHRYNASTILMIDNYIPIGTGPYKYEEYDKFKSMTLVANDDYREGKPTIERIIGKILENQELIKSSYDAGQIHVAPISEVDRNKYKQYNRTNIIEYISSDYELLSFNLQNEILGNESGKIIRQAISHAINRNRIIEKIYLGHAVANYLPIHPKSWLNNQLNIEYEYNRSHSIDLLNQGGFVDLDGDGIREDVEGETLEFNIITNNTNLLRIKAVEMIKDDLEKIGIKLTLDIVPNYKDIDEDAKLNDLNNTLDIIRAGKYDIALIGMQMSIIPDLSFLYHSKEIGNNNFSKYASPLMDQYLNNAFVAQNEEQKLKAYGELLNLVYEELPYISLYNRNNAILIDSMIMGEIRPNFINPYNGLEKCFVVERIE